MALVSTSKKIIVSTRAEENVVTIIDRLTTQPYITILEVGAAEPVGFIGGYMVCKFCKLYKYRKQAAKEYKKETGINTTFRTSLIEIRTKDRVRRGTLTHNSVKLVFCPECGTRLNGSRIGGAR